MSVKIAEIRLRLAQALRNRGIWFVSVSPYVHGGAPHLLAVLPNGRTLGIYPVRPDGAGSTSQAQLDTIDYLERAGIEVIFAGSVEDLEGALGG